jgi:hypothetical protein
MLCSRDLAFLLYACIALYCFVFVVVVVGRRIGAGEEEYKVLLHHNVEVFHNHYTIVRVSYVQLTFIPPIAGLILLYHILSSRLQEIHAVKTTNQSTQPRTI